MHHGSIAKSSNWQGKFFTSIIYVQVLNTGAKDGSHSVLLYREAVKLVVRFEKVSVEAGHIKHFELNMLIIGWQQSKLECI